MKNHYFLAFTLPSIEHEKLDETGTFTISNITPGLNRLGILTFFPRPTS